MPLQPLGFLAGLGQELASLHVPLGGHVHGRHADLVRRASERVRDRVGQLRHDPGLLLGSIRWGRSDAQKAEIVSELTRSVADALGLEAAEVGVVTVDIPSRWNMEGGELLPEPGEEEAWLARHR